MKFRMLGATAIAALLVAIAAPAPLAFAQTPPAAAGPVLTKQMVKPYNEAITAIQAKDYATAQAKITEASAQAKTPVDKGQVERLKLQVAIDTKNAAQQIASVNTLLTSGTLGADEVKQYKGALSGMYSAAGDETNALVALRAYVDEFNSTPDNLISIADKASKQNDFATAATYAEKAIAASTSATGAPETWYRLYMRSLQQSGQEDKYYSVMETVVVKFPKEEYWRFLLGRAQKEPKFSNDMYLDLYRALQEAGAKLTPQERSKAADEAMRRGLPGEALTLLESANARGEVTSDFDKKNLAQARSQSASDKAGLAKDTKDALAKGDATRLALTGEAQLSYGDNAKAVELLKAAIAKGISDPAKLAATKLHLGIAQYRAGDTAGAKATWAEVQSDDGAGRLARSWVLIVDANA
ncbi:MAG: hypothetical protein ABMA14_14730 [Hyphomonadaceae bacterium]